MPTEVRRLIVWLLAVHLMATMFKPPPPAVCPDAPPLLYAGLGSTV